MSRIVETVPLGTKQTFAVFNEVMGGIDFDSVDLISPSQLKPVKITELKALENSRKPESLLPLYTHLIAANVPKKSIGEYWYNIRAKSRSYVDWSGDTTYPTIYISDDILKNTSGPSHTRGQASLDLALELARATLEIQCFQNMHTLPADLWSGVFRRNMKYYFFDQIAQLYGSALDQDAFKRAKMYMNAILNFHEQHRSRVVSMGTEVILVSNRRDFETPYYRIGRGLGWYIGDRLIQEIGDRFRVGAKNEWIMNTPPPIRKPLVSMEDRRNIDEDCRKLELPNVPQIYQGYKMGWIQDRMLKEQLTAGTLSTWTYKE